MTATKIKRVAVISDTHCGHLVGLTPPAWQTKETKGSTTKHNKWAKVQKELWQAYCATLTKIGPIDRLIHVGDMVDGKGKKSGGVEQITTSMEEQSDMAVACCDQVRLHARKGYKAYGVFGTGYHVSPDGDDWESVVARRAGFEKIGSHEWITVNGGCMFDVKHHIGGSGIPHGRHTAMAKENLWAQMWAINDLAPRSESFNIILRGHVHFFNYCGGPGWLGMTCPPLQGMGSTYGARRCNGIVDWGMMHFDIGPKGELVDWQYHITRIASQKPEVVRA